MALNKVIVNVAIAHEDSWYHRGAARLKESLKQINEDADLVFTSNTQSISTPYIDKLISIVDAYNAGYKHILYLDCSIMALKSIQPIWDMIASDGYYLYKSGFNCANTASDNVLNHFGLTRNTVEKWDEAATNVIGVNADHWFGQKLIKELQMHYIPECVNTIKWPTEEERLRDSKDPRFMFNRQDQTVISLIAGKYNMPIHDNIFVWRDELDNKLNETHLLRLRGGY